MPEELEQKAKKKALIRRLWPLVDTMKFYPGYFGYSPSELKQMELMDTLRQIFGEEQYRWRGRKPFGEVLQDYYHMLEMQKKYREPYPLYFQPSIGV